MSVIQSLRTKYAKLVGFIIAISLIGFLLMDAGDNIKKIFTGSEFVAEINGEKIDPIDYSIRINEMEGLYALMGNELDENMKAQVHTQVLNEMMYEKLIAEDMEELGITITKEEEREMITGSNPNPMVMSFPYFRNAEGQFDPQALMAFETGQLDMNNPQQAKAMEQWEIMKNYIKRQALIQKYNSLISGAIYTPKFIADKLTKDQLEAANIQFVKIPFTTIPDSEVKVTEEEINQYLKDHEKQYQTTDPTRGMEYVAFNVVPSKDDTTAVLNNIKNIKQGFIDTDDNESYVNSNSEEGYTGIFVNKKTYMSRFSDSIMSLPVGAVYGPYFEDGSYKLTKVEAKAVLPDSVKARHILIKTHDKGMEVLAENIAKARMDSVQMLLASGKDFNELVTTYSEDEGSKNTGGEYDFTLAQRPQISKEFGDFIFEGKTGQSKVVQVNNDNYAGFHLVEILSQSTPQPVVKLATISQPLFPSSETENLIYAKVNEFAGRNQTAKAFDETVKKEQLNKLVAQNIKINDMIIPGIGTSREVIRWMYEAEVGDISPIFNLDGRYIIGKLTDINEKGLMKIDESNRPMLEAKVKAEKKADLIAKKYKAASLEAIAQSSGQQIQNLDSISLASAYLPNIGYEPKVIGYSFSDKLKPNTVSEGIKGTDGVFFISLKNKWKKDAATANPMQMEQQVQMQNMQLKNSVNGMLQQILLGNAEIEYSAANIY